MKTIEKRSLRILPMVFVVFILSAGVPAQASAAEQTARETGQEMVQEEPEMILSLESTDNMKVSAFASNNKDTFGPKHEGEIYIGYAITDGELDTDNSNWEGDAAEIALNNAVTGEGFTAVRVTGDSQVHITGRLEVKDDSEGRVVSDFNGIGTAVTGSEGACIYVDDMAFYSEGFERAFAVLEDSSMIIRNSDILTMGNDPFKNAWDGYYNSAKASIMISPPWVLGIQGGVRLINILGRNTSLVVADSALTAGGWGVLATDACLEPYLWVFGSSLNILPASQGGMNSGWKILGYEEDEYGSGYGSYLIGEAREYFYGTVINGATYASILDQGYAYYQGMKEGEVIEEVDASGNYLGRYIAGDPVNTIIHTVFGFMAHDVGEIHVLEGTIVDTAECIFLHKAGDVIWDVSGAALVPGNGIILQMMDNDDPTVGGIDPFGTYLVEAAGFPEAEPNEAIEDDDPEGTAGEDNPGDRVELNLADGIYIGDIYNATGYYGQASDFLTVTIAKDAEFDGDIMLASHIHGIWLNGRSVEEVVAAIDEANAYHDEIGGYYADTDPIEYAFIDADGQVTEDKDQAVAIQFLKFSILEYYLMGHVINKIGWNGSAGIDVKVEGMWNVASVSLLTSLEIGENAHVFGEITVLEDGSILLVPSMTEAAPGKYGPRQ